LSFGKYAIHTHNPAMLLGGWGGAPLYLVEHMRKQGVFKEGIILENINFVDPIIMYFLTIFFKTLWVG
jgi:hypothetical protein